MNRRLKLMPPVLLLAASAALMFVPMRSFAADGGGLAPSDAGTPGDASAPDSRGGGSSTAPVDGAAASDGGAPDPVRAQAASPPPPRLLAPAHIPPPTPEAPQRIETLTVVGTRESRTAGSAHVLRPRDLQRLNYDNAETVIKAVPGVYARGEDGFGLRPNIGIRGTSPDRSKKVTLMEDGILFGPAPYSAPAAYFFPLMARMELIRVIKGPGAVSFGPQTVGGAIDFVTRPIPAQDSGAIDVSAGTYGYGKVHGYYGASTARSGYVLEGVHLRSTGFKNLDGGGDTGFEKNEWMWKGRYLLSTDPAAAQTLGLKVGYADEDSRESYLGLTDADLRANPNRRYRASQLDRMMWHRTQIAATYQARLGPAVTIDAAVYRHDFSRTWRKLNRLGVNRPLDQILADPTSVANAIYYSVLTGASDTSSGGAAERAETLYIGPNQRDFVSQGAQVLATWQGMTGPVAHRLQAGARFHYDRIERLHKEDGYLMRGGSLIHNGAPTIVNVDQRAWTHALALHAIDAASYGPVTVTPGVRVEIIDSWLRDRKAGTDVKGAPQRVVIPGLGIYGALTPAFGLLAGIYRGFSPAAPGEPANVKPEISVNYEAGARLSTARLRLEAIGFFNDYQNLTAVCGQSSSCEAADVDKQTDAGRAHIYGAELFARGEAVLTPGLVVPFMAAYTYTRTELLQAFTSADPTLKDARPGDELPFVPRHQASTSVAIESRRSALALGGTYVAAMREHVRGPTTTPDTPLTDASFILDATARVNVATSGQIYLNVRNLLGADDIAARLPFGARPVAPRWIQLGTKWSF